MLQALGTLFPQLSSFTLVILEDSVGWGLEMSFLQRLRVLLVQNVLLLQRATACSEVQHRQLYFLLAQQPNAHVPGRGSFLGSFPLFTLWVHLLQALGGLSLQQVDDVEVGGERRVAFYGSVRSGGWASWPASGSLRLCC